MNRHTLRVLEFEIIRREVRSYCLTAEAARLVRRERIHADRSDIELLLDQVSAVRFCLLTTVEWPTLRFPPVEAVVDRVALDGVVLEAAELAAISEFAQSSSKLRDYLDAASGEDQRSAALIGPLASAIPDLSKLAEGISHVVDPEGNIREKEIPELKRIRSEINRAQQDLQRTAQSLITRDDMRRFWNATVPTQREGRTVLALKSDHRGKVRGIVHEVSATGATVFVEPDVLVEKNNAVVEADNRYRSELLKILRELSARCRGEQPALILNISAVVAIDRIYARARYGHLHGCERAANSGGTVALRNARHPLLGEAAVPISVEFPEGKRVLIITGPNTGGKTVALKTVGLLALMSQFGLEIPAAPDSALPIFSGVFADIGDEQSIEQSLSTFSGHMRNIARILNSADSDSLVLLDELGSGTDPEEGGALAMAVLDELLDRRPYTVVTTHHGSLKHYGFTHDHAANASVEFDAKSLRPTYHIIPGVPGSSHAIEVAAQMGLLRKVTASARNYLSDKEYDTGRIIRVLTDREQQLHRERERVSDTERELEQERSNLQDRVADLVQQESELRQQKLREFDAWSAETRKRLEKLVREIREGELTREKTQSVKQFISELDAASTAERERTPKPVKASQPADAISIGEGVEVEVRSSRKKGTVVRQGKGNTWVVQLDQVKLPIEASDLVAIRSDERAELAVHYQPVTGHAALELDLRGFRLEEAVDEVERQIDQALLAGMSRFGIIHGMGEGVLQQGIRDLLRRHPHVGEFDYARPEDGGFGKTNVTLK